MDKVSYPLISKEEVNKMEKKLQEILDILPEKISKIIKNALLSSGTNKVEEIRLRTGRPLIVDTAIGKFTVLSGGSLSPALGGAYIVTSEDINKVFMNICENSVYAYMEEIRQGFITIRGGHRIGFTGKAVMENGAIINIKEINAVNIRISGEVKGCAIPYIDRIINEGKIKNTLIISPPGCGKTTMLRDITRLLSDSCLKVGVCDERGEIAQMYHGEPQCEIGTQTDVIVDAPKDMAIDMFLRTMSPDVIICDELTQYADSRAVSRCFGTGVNVIASIHGDNIEDIKNKEIFKDIIGGSGFSQALVLSANKKLSGERIVVDFYDL